MHRFLPLLRMLPLAFVFGCASPGPPRPPSLHLPERATGLAAERVAGEVHLSWTSPVNTTDGDRIQGGMAAVLCRELPPKAGCLAVQRASMGSGASVMTDALPTDLSSGPPRLLLYRVELLNGRGRSAGASDPVFAAAGAAPPPVGVLTLSARRNAVLVRWPPPAALTSSVMELKRTRTATADGAASSAAPLKPSGPSAPMAPNAPSKRDGSRRAPKPPAGDAILRSTPPQVNSAPANGLLDPTVTDAESYAYVAQRVMDVTVSGHPLELRGLSSPVASITFRDVAPPAAPTGLVVIPGGGFGAELSLDLSWEPNAENDLLGYNVYRRTGNGEFLRVNADPVPASAYRDLRISARETYTYRITAVDQRGNESGPSAEVRETPRP